MIINVIITLVNNLHVHASVTHTSNHTTNQMAYAPCVRLYACTAITTAQEEDVRLERSKTFTQTVAPKLRIPSQVAERREIFAKARPFSLLNLPTTDGTASRENNRASVSVARWGSESSEHCYFCGKRVYLMERVSANGLNLHRNCFRCAHCRTQLEVGGYCLSKAEGTEKAKLFCTAHYMQIFLSNPRALNYSRSGIAERFGSSITIEEEPKTEETVTLEQLAPPVAAEPQVTEVQAVQAVQPDIEESSPAQPAEVTAPSQPAIEITEPDDQVCYEIRILGRLRFPCNDACTYMYSIYVNATDMQI